MSSAISITSLPGTYFDENGWRENSPSRVYQAFGKVGWQNDKTDFDLSYTYADTSLFGNGATPVSMLDYDYESSYTPDSTANLLSFVNLTATQFLADKLLLSGNVYYRHLITNAVNGNTNDSYLDGDYGGPPLDCTAPGASLAALTYCHAGTECDLATRAKHQRRRAAAHRFRRTCSAGRTRPPSARTYTDSDDSFSQAYQYGGLTPDRVLIYTVSPYNNETVISLSGENKIYGTYFTDTLSPSKLLHFTLSVRYNRSTETLERLQHRYGYRRFRQRLQRADHAFGRPHLQPRQSRLRLHCDADRYPDFLRRITTRRAARRP